MNIQQLQCEGGLVVSATGAPTSTAGVCCPATAGGDSTTATGVCPATTATRADSSAAGIAHTARAASALSVRHDDGS